MFSMSIIPKPGTRLLTLDDRAAAAPETKNVVDIWDVPARGGFHDLEARIPIEELLLGGQVIGRLSANVLEACHGAGFVIELQDVSHKQRQGRERRTRTLMPAFLDMVISNTGI